MQAITTSRPLTRTLSPGGEREFGLPSLLPSGEKGRMRGSVLFALLLVLLLPLRGLLAFVPDAVVAGQWWRVLTHPFVHVNWYHALLDGAAFLLLYRMIEGPRVSYCIAAGAGSLLAAIWYWPAIGATGLCGLSGVAHGLMAVSALEMIRSGMEGHAPSWPSAPSNSDATERVPPTTVGWVCLALVTGKSVWEAATGHVFFTWLHFGMLGTPVAVCHLGGVLGALLLQGSRVLVRKGGPVNNMPEARA